VLLQESSDVGRSILAALENTKFFKVTHRARNVAEMDRLLASGTVLFAVEVPAGFERALRRGERPALLVAADATDPVATGSAMSALNQLVRTALQHDRAVPDGAAPVFEIRQHNRYNPAGTSQLNIVPGLMGTILTLTMLIFTALSVTREMERGTMESLLAMPITPLEIMLGKIAPYVLIGFLQAALIFGAGILLFSVPILGDLTVLALLTTLFIATNLSIGYTFSTLAQNQLQAIQMAMMFFLPNILLSGFVFPFLGMPLWAQWFGEFLPLTHYIRIVRAIMLKGSTLGDLHVDVLWLIGLMLLAMTIAVTRFRRTLD
jgi:ABC-2 type transport system permease protein